MVSAGVDMLLRLVEPKEILSIFRAILYKYAAVQVRFLPQESGTFIEFFFVVVEWFVLIMMKK